MSRRDVAGVQLLAAPWQVSRTNVRRAEELSSTRFVASESNATKRPSALIEGEALAPFASFESELIDMRVVAGVQSAAAPKHVSRINTSATPLLSPGTRFVASETNTTKRPSALIAGERLPPSASGPMSDPETSAVLGTHPAGAPSQVSRTKMWSMAVVVAAGVESGKTSAAFPTNAT